MAERVAAPGAGTGEPQPMSGCFVWLGWMFGGNTILMAVTILIARGARWTLTYKDVVFWMVLGLTVLLRYVDLRWISRRTADREPGALRHFRRYAATLIVSWSVLWAVAHSMALDE